MIALCSWMCEKCIVINLCFFFLVYFSMSVLFLPLLLCVFVLVLSTFICLDVVRGRVFLFLNYSPKKRRHSYEDY